MDLEARERGAEERREKSCTHINLWEIQNGTAHVHTRIKEWVVRAQKEEDDSKTGEKILSLEARELLITSNVKSLFCLCA